MSVIWKIMIFSMGLILIFMIPTYMLPQIKGKAPADEDAIDFNNMTMERFVALGKDLAHNKGACILCHNNLGRAPDLLAIDVVADSLTRLADPRYKGSAKSAEQYIRESMLAPDAFVVAGFGKKGTNDTESPMPAADKAPTLLSAVEIDAIIAYLEAKDGYDVTVSLPSAAESGIASQGEKPGDKPVEPAAQLVAANDAPLDGPALVAKYNCNTCHTIGAIESPIGPNLNGVGQRLTLDQLRGSIIAPGETIVAGFPAIMPDFSGQMSVRELETLVKYLANNNGTPQDQSAPQKE